MKRFKMSICMILAALLVLSGMTAFAGVKYSNPEGLGKVKVRATATPIPQETPIPSDGQETAPAPEVTPVPETTIVPETTVVPEDKPENPDYYFQRDADGNLILDENGDPILMVSENAQIPTSYERDENGDLVLDENGDPIPTFSEEETETPAPEVTPEPDDEPSPEETAEPDVEPDVKATAEPIEEPTVMPTVEPAVEIGYTYQRDENGDLVLDKNGDPIVIVPEGWEIPVTWTRDENGNLILDENGDPIPSQTVPAEAEKLQTITDALNPDRYIDIYAAWEGERLYFGEEATLIAVLHGYDNMIYTVQWQYSKDNAEWHDLEGADALRHTLVVTEDNYLNYWRIAVIISGVAE